MSQRTASESALKLLGAFYLLFYLSGLCALGYQLVWSRLFAFGLGHELPGLLAVLVAFFAGVALGAWIFDARLARAYDPARCYGVLELLIGAWGLLSILLIPSANEFALRLIGSEPSASRHWIVTFVFPFVVLLPATAGMGATLPAIERATSLLTAQGRTLGALYAANTLGAVTGTLVCAFFAVPAFGFTKTLLFLGTLNLICGFVALILIKSSDVAHRKATATSAAPQTNLRLAVTIFATGFLGIGFEVLGVRVLAQVLENTIYTFASVLAVYLFGTAAGGVWFQRYGVSSGPLVSRALIALAASCSLSGSILWFAPAIYQWLRGAFGDSTLGVMGAEMALATAVFGAPTFLMGALFTCLAESARRADRGVGTALALNTLGAAVAPILFGLGLFPQLGAKWTLVVISAGYLLLVPWNSRGVPRTPLPPPGEREGVRRPIPSIARKGLAWFLPVAAIALLPKQIQLVQVPPGGAVVEYRNGVMDSVAVAKHFDGNRSLLVNNRFIMGGTGAASAARRHAHIPLLLHPRPKLALFLGLGTGISFGGVAPHEAVQADAVELIPEIPSLLHHFEPHNLRRDGMKIHVADARRFVHASDRNYDVIVADLFHPARDGAGSLYTVEHFQAIRRHLAPGGLFCQWLPLFQLDEPMLQLIARTFLQVFPEARAFLLRFNVDTPVLGLIAILETKKYPFDWMQGRLAGDDLVKELKAQGLADSFHLFGGYMAGADSLRSFAGEGSLNTDDRPLVIFGAPRFSYERQETSYGRLLSLLDATRADTRELIDASDPAGQKFAEDLSEFIRARNIYLRGLVAEAKGYKEEAINAYVESARASQNFSTGYAQCLTIAAQQSKTDVPAARALLQRLVEAQPSRPVAKQLLDRLSTGR